MDTSTVTLPVNVVTPGEGSVRSVGFDERDHLRQASWCTIR
jgi:hypothetical protein